VKNLPGNNPPELTLYSSLNEKLDVSFGQNNENPARNDSALKP
jgi:hypothetical protein